jgi:hypothetical protein
MKRLWILLVLVCAFGAAEALSWQAIDQKIYTISTTYQKGKARELMGAYPQAVDAYAYALQESNTLLRNPGLKREQIIELLPYTIAIAYRLSIANEKMVNGSMVYLYEQIDLYKKTDTLISDVITSVSNMRIDYKLDVPVIYYAHLYYARALNNMGMSYALSNGIFWKKYLVYMPSDIVMIMENVRKDLQHYQYLCGMQTTTNVAAAIENALATVNDSSNLSSALQLSFYIDTRDGLQQALVNRFTNGVFVVSQRYDNNSSLWKDIADCKTYEDFESNAKSRQFVAEIKQELEILKKY